MKSALRPDRHDLVVAVAVGTIVTSLWFCVTWRYGLDLADEGFYWYGAQRVLRGEVPLRDFWSYDIGRYYWAAAFMFVAGQDGVLAARLAAAVFQALGTSLGVYICLFAWRRTGAARWILALSIACILTVWALPYYKAYDHAASIMIVAALILMLKVAKPGAWLAAGVCIGVVAMIGRNHGLYGAVSASVIILIMVVKAPLRRRQVIGLSGYFLLGVVIGFAPTLVMMVFVHGFAEALVNSMAVQIRSGATNIGLPVPWPWLEDLHGTGLLVGATRLALGMGFIFLLTFPLLGMLALASRRFDWGNDRLKVFAAALIVAFSYAQYAFSRADVVHLVLGMVPALIGLLVAAGAMSTLRLVTASVVVLAASIVAVADAQPYLSARLLKRTWLEADVDGQSVRMLPYIYKQLQFANQTLRVEGGGVRKFLAVPDMTSLYAIYRAKMPIWEIYSVFSRDAKFESAEIARLDSFRPELVLLSNHDMDGRADLRYKETHPLTYDWIVSGYRIIASREIFSEYVLKAYSARN